MSFNQCSLNATVKSHHDHIEFGRRNHSFCSDDLVGHQTSGISLPCRSASQKTEQLQTSHAALGWNLDTTFVSARWGKDGPCLPASLCVFTVFHEWNLSLPLSLQDLASGMVVADIQLISDKESIPHGYCYIAEHLEPSKHTHTHAHTLYLKSHCWGGVKITRQPHRLQPDRFSVRLCVQRRPSQRRSGCVCSSSQWAVWTQLCWISNWQPKAKWCYITTHMWG